MDTLWQPSQYDCIVSSSISVQDSLEKQQSLIYGQSWLPRSGKKIQEVDFVYFLDFFWGEGLNFKEKHVFPIIQ